MGLIPIAGSSEAREAHVVSVILREDSWILPLRNGVIPSKPPLFHWVAALLSMVSGSVSEFSVRMTSQVATALCFVLVAAIGYRLANLQQTFQGQGHPRRTAILAAGILSLTYGFYIMGCQAMVDMTFAACVWSSLAALTYGIVDSKKASKTKRIHWLGRAFFWTFVSLGVLARGPIGFVLPLFLVTIVGLIVAGVKRTSIEFVTPSIGWLSFGIPIAWYIAAYSVGGEAFLERQIFFENLKRFSGGEFVNSEAWWFYLPSILRTTFPWGVLLLCVIAKEFRWRRTLSYSDERAHVRWLPTILLCGGMVLFSLSSGKRHSYLLPLIPLLALQLGLEISSLIERGGVALRQKLRAVGRRIESCLIGVSLCALILLTIVVASALVTHQLAAQTYSAAAPVIARMGVVLVGISLLIFSWPRRSLVLVGAFSWFLMLSVMTTVVSAGAAAKGYLKGFDTMGATWLATIREGEELAVLKHPFDEYFDPILFYVRRPVRLVSLELAPDDCRENTVYASKRAWLDAHENMFRGVVVRVVTVRERLQAYKGKTDRDVVFFRCSTFAQRGVDNQPILHDAGYQGMPL